MKRRPTPFRLRPVTLAVLGALGATVVPAAANPLNPTVVGGSATFATSGKVLTVTNSNGAIINWQAFSIGAGETTRFVQSGPASQVLNRVTGRDPSTILGTLQSNGRVFLVNPNGIVFGKGSRVDVAGLVASTLDIRNEDFGRGHLEFAAGAGAGGIRNEGVLRAAPGGRIVLLAPQVENSGLIEAPGGEILLAAGRRVSLVDLNHPDVEFDVVAPANAIVNLGQVLAKRIGLYAGVIDAGGTLDASAAVVGEGGRIYLKAAEGVRVAGTLAATGERGGSITVLGREVDLAGTASLDASGRTGGGTLLVGGDARGANPDVPNAAFSTVAAGASLRADAGERGDGGKVVVWADDTTLMAGSISARGGGKGGDGGFAEVSGKRRLQMDGHADLTAPAGRTGTLLMDPGAISVTTGANNAATGTVNNTWLGTQLNSSHLELATSNDAYSTSGATQNISISAPVTWSTGNTLTLTAGNNISIGAAITSTGGGLTLAAGGTRSISAPVDLGGGTLTLNGATSLATGGNLKNLGSATGGSLSLASGTVFIDNVTLNTDLAINGGTAVLRNAVNLAGGHSISVGGASAYGDLRYDGTATLGGTGNLVFAAGAGYNSQLWYYNVGSGLTVGPGITVSGSGTGTAYFGYYNTDQITFQGTWNAGVSGKS
ncbi:MAG: filamentous hemagglutinin N-terminal domain-containing protein, partial [Rhodocyclaceae bacterium]|nr:filamentous hemagglutinin N-terminal domain-containing protein [Rhodocyclaceae bacterium]